MRCDIVRRFAPLYTCTLGSKSLGSVAIPVLCLAKVKLHHCATLAIERSSASDVAETIEHHLGAILGLVWSHRYVYMFGPILAQVPCFGA